MKKLTINIVRNPNSQVIVTWLFEFLEYTKVSKLV